MTDTVSRTYTVRGMTCHHCAASVREEVGEVAGVEDVVVDLASGRVEVRGPSVSAPDVKAAVEEAGYEFAGER